MSPAEKRAKARLLDALRGCHGEDFILDGLGVDKPREIEQWARSTHGAWGRKKGREAVTARIVLAELAAAAQSYADVHERAEGERTRQRGATTGDGV